MSTGIYDPAIYDPAIYDTGAVVVTPTGFIPRDSLFSITNPEGPVATVSAPNDIEAEVEP